MIRRPPRSTRTDTLFPYPPLFRSTILYDYPSPEAALARPKPGDPRLAERFELFACGVELANAFGELRDPVEQRRRFELDMDEKQRLYGERYPIDADFLDALPHMPDSSGGALGFDRLVMLLVGAPGVEDVKWRPVRVAPSWAGSRVGQAWVGSCRSRWS